MENHDKRIIGDFLEINADIVKERFESKLPNFLADLRSNYYRNKLIKSAKKLKNSNLPLSTENLYEFFIYVYNNFPPHGAFQSVILTKLNERDEGTNIEAVIQSEDLNAIISIDESETGFKVSISKRKTSDLKNGCTIHCKDRLVSTNSNSAELVTELNNLLLSDISDYIISIISAYTNKKGE